MQILSVEPFRKKKILVTFDSGEKLALYVSEGKRYGVQEGEMFSEEAYEDLKKEVLIPRGRKRVLHLLESMDRTEAALRGKLKESFFPEDVIEDAITYAKKFHYIDDERYLQNYLTGQLKKKSSKQVAFELERKGIERSSIQNAIEEYYRDNPEMEKEAALRFFEKKLKNFAEEKEICKVKQALFRKGFSYCVIERALAAFTEEQERRLSGENFEST